MYTRHGVELIIKVMLNWSIELDIMAFGQYSGYPFSPSRMEMKEDEKSRYDSMIKDVLEDHKKIGNHF
jgi:hypothetical protein